MIKRNINKFFEIKGKGYEITVEKQSEDNYSIFVCKEEECISSKTDLTFDECVLFFYDLSNRYFNGMLSLERIVNLIKEQFERNNEEEEKEEEELVHDLEIVFLNGRGIETRLSEESYLDFKSKIHSPLHKVVSFVDDYDEEYLIPNKELITSIRYNKGE